MTRELVDRMRTCSAAILADVYTRHQVIPLLYADAADLLVEASNLLDRPEPLGEPMEILEARPAQTNSGAGMWTTLELPTRPVDYGPHHPRPCPSCGSIDARTVHRINRRLMLTCPECSHQWEYAP